MSPTTSLRQDSLGGVVTLDVPADFHQVPIDPAVEDRVAAQTALVRALGLTDPRQREGVELYVEGLARAVTAGRVGAAAFCLVEIDDAPSTASLTVALQPAGTPDAGVAVLGVLEALRRSGAYDDVRLDRTGGRPIAMATRERQGEREVLLGVRVPGHDALALVCLTSPDRDRWPLYEQVARQAAGSVRLEPRAAPA